MPETTFGNYNNNWKQMFLIKMPSYMNTSIWALSVIWLRS